MSIETNKALVRRVIEEIYNQDRYEVADEIISADYISHNGGVDQLVGAAGVKERRASSGRPSPDLHTTIDDLIAEGDKVVLRARDRMTHVNAFLGYAPADRTFEMTWMQIVRVEDDKLVESWWEMDMELFRKHLSREI